MTNFTPAPVAVPATETALPEKSLIAPGVPAPFLADNRYHMPTSLAIRRAAWTRTS